MDTNTGENVKNNGKLVLPQNMVLRDGVLYFRARAGGRLLWKKCPWQGVDVAISRKGNIMPCVKKSLAEWLGDVRDKADQRKRDPDSVPDGRVLSWADFTPIYLDVADAQYAKDRKPAPATAKNNVQRLFLLLSEAGIGKTEAMDQALPERLEKWIQVQRRAAKDEEDEDRIRYRLARTIAMAESCWSRWTREPLRRRGVHVPACLDRWPTVSAEAPVYDLPPENIQKATREGARKMEQEDPATWLAFALMRNCGMRPGDMQRADWAWFKTLQDGSVWLFFCPHKTRRSSRSREVHQRISKAFWDRLQDAWSRVGDPGAFVVPGGPAGRLAALERVNAYMRGWGWETEKVAYELRKLFGSEIYNAHGIRYASEYLGDNEMTVSRYYARACPKSAPELVIDHAAPAIE